MLVAGNWKMNKNIKETKFFFKEFNKLVVKAKNEIVVCPSFSCISVARETALKQIHIGSQNVFFEEKGEFTGEVSVNQLKGLCDFIILGHSDRRHKFFESNELINKKLSKALESGFNVILCVGETLEEKNTGKTSLVLKTQLINSLKSISFSSKLLIAYEPVWAIGTGKHAEKKDIFETHKFIKQQLVFLFGEKANKLRVLYGGSINSENVKDVFSVEYVDGVLVGGASLDPKKFAEICNYKK